MADNKPNPIEMDVTVTYHITSLEALAKDIAGAMLVFLDLKSDVERKLFISNLFSGLYKPTKAADETAPAEESSVEDAAPAEETKAEEKDYPYMVNLFEDAKKH